MKENLKYNDRFHGLDGPPSPEGNPAHGDQGFEVPPAAKAPEKTSRRGNKARKAIKEFLGGDYLSKEWVTGNLSYILYVALLTVIYIANTYYAEKKFKSIETTKTELKELRYGYITTKSALMFQGRQSEISKRAVLLGLKEVKMPPYKILYSGESLEPTKQ